jgi:hypothetical protein
MQFLNLDSSKYLFQDIRTTNFQKCYTIVETCNNFQMKHFKLVYQQNPRTYITDSQHKLSKFVSSKAIGSNETRKQHQHIFTLVENKPNIQDEFEL